MAINRRVGDRIIAWVVDNVALATILLSWRWNFNSDRIHDDWRAAEGYDFLGVDHYQEQKASFADTGTASQLGGGYIVLLIGDDITLLHQTETAPQEDESSTQRPSAGLA